MARMIEMIRQSAVPVSIMRSAARGGLSLPAVEMVEILVYLSSHSLFGEQARLSLGSWDSASARALCVDPSTPPEILDYFLDSQNCRAPLVASLCENPRVEESKLLQLASIASTDQLTAMLTSQRAHSFESVLQAIMANPHLGDKDRAELHRQCETSGGQKQTPDTSRDAAEEEILQVYQTEHAEEIASEQHKSFELVQEHPDEEDELAEALVEAKKLETQAPRAPVKEPERVSTLQRIARMTVGERVQLAMKGTKDERFILIRDGSKVVSLAVLESPKLSEAEMETFAAMKNVQQAVLRGIAGKRRFMKQYAVVRALANNPRCPLEISLSLLPHLLTNDLHGLSRNKNIGDTLRKIAHKMFKTKNESRKA